MATKINLEDRDLIVEIAKLFIDSPYQLWWNGVLPWDPFDCSRFVQVVFENVWITLERNSALQWKQFSSTWNMNENLESAEIWDLIFYKNTYESENEITHVWLYIWNNKMINATWKKIQINTIDKYRKNHFKWVWKLTCFTKQYSKATATKNFDRLSDKEAIQKANTLKAVNAVIAVLTSTWWDLPSEYQDLSASYAKKLRTDYPEARPLEPDQAKKVYQSVVDILSYSWKFAWWTEQKKYEDLARYLRKNFWLK